MLTIVRWFEIFFALIPIKILMKMFFFSEEFSNTVALPMIALFLGTGNATPEVPSIILERLVTSPTYGMWYPGDKLSVASNLPPMVVFPNFSNFYEDWRKDLLSRGVNVRLSTEVTRVVKRDKTGVIVKMIHRRPGEDNHTPDSVWSAPHGRDADKEEIEECYDELVLCTLYVLLSHISYHGYIPLLLCHYHQYHPPLSLSNHNSSIHMQGRYRKTAPLSNSKLPRKEGPRSNEMVRRHHCHAH